MSFHSLFLAIGLVTLVGTLISLRREHIRAEYSLSWLIVGVILTSLAVYPGALEFAARFLDLDSRLFFLIVGGALISGLLFEISHVVSKLRDENVILTQRLAILEYRIRQTNEGHGQTNQ